MKKILMAATAALALSAGSALADYTLIVPQEPGGGTSVWATIVAEQLEPFLGEPVVVQHQPGARDIPGFNLWHNELRKDPKTIMVSHGGNGVSFLQEEVEYDYSQYESVGLMNLNIIAAREAGMSEDDVVKFAAGSGMEPEAMAMTMLLCGPGLTVDEYVACFKERVVWVKGMDGSERRLAFERGELNGTRETPAAFKKYFQPMIDGGVAELWFHHGLFDIATGQHVDDPNYPGYQFEILFEKKWGVKPSGEMYETYNLLRSFRDVLQKAMWMDPASPYLDEVREALTKMSQDPAAMEKIRADVGNYEWVIGEDADALRDHLMTLITDDELKNLVKFNSEALGLASVYKPELVK